MSHTFHVTVNGGPEKTVTVKCSEYISAAAAVPATLGFSSDDFPLKIVIWVPALLPEYGPYTYVIERAGGPVLF